MVEELVGYDGASLCVSSSGAAESRVFVLLRGRVKGGRAAGYIGCRVLSIVCPRIAENCDSTIIRGVCTYYRGWAPRLHSSSLLLGGDSMGVKKRGIYVGINLLKESFYLA